MELKHYVELVYFQFYRKVDEVNYFLAEAVDNAVEYKAAPSPKDDRFIDKMQFTFSGYINALVSTWEVVKVSRMLENEINDKPSKERIVSDKVLESDGQTFSEYLACGSEEHYWFCFMKAARNANTHDGSLVLNGGDVEQFLFQTDLHRYKWDGNSGKFIYEHSQSPKGKAVSVMLTSAIKLAPVFEKWLERPSFSIDDQHSFAEFKVRVPQFLAAIGEGRSEAVKAMAQAQLDGPEKLSTVKVTDSWLTILKSL